MENLRAFLRLPVAMSLLREHMNDHRLVIILGALQGMLQGSDVVAIDGPKIVKTQRLKKALTHKNGLHRVFHPKHHLP